MTTTAKSITDIFLNQDPMKPEKNIPAKPDHNPDPTKIRPGGNEPLKNDPTRIEEPTTNDPTKIEEPQRPSVPGKSLHY